VCCACVANYFTVVLEIKHPIPTLTGICDRRLLAAAVGAGGRATSLLIRRGYLANDLLSRLLFLTLGTSVIVSMTVTIVMSVIVSMVVGLLVVIVSMLMTMAVPVLVIVTLLGSLRVGTSAASSVFFRGVHS